MHDIKAIRDNPDAYDRAWASKGLDAQSPTILDLDRTLRGARIRDAGRIADGRFGLRVPQGTVAIDAFGPTPIVDGATSTLTLTITNPNT